MKLPSSCMSDNSPFNSVSFWWRVRMLGGVEFSSLHNGDGGRIADVARSGQDQPD